MITELYLGDCLDVMPHLEDQSMDAIIADLPYGTTQCAWDILIPFVDLWKQYKRLIKPHGAIVLFGTQPFTSLLITSNLPWFKYCWDWDKNTGKGHLVAKYRPMQQTEQIAVFGKGRVNYYPIMIRRTKPVVSVEGSRTSIMGGKQSSGYTGKISRSKFPRTLLRCPWGSGSRFHPTQKPLTLLSYLIGTYTKEGGTVLDNTMGVGSTGIACVHAKRNFVGVELDPVYYDLAMGSIEHAKRGCNV